MAFKLIKSPEGLREGNLIFVDSTVFPPNFICAKIEILGKEFEKSFTLETMNCAYLNAEERYIKDLFPEEKEKIFYKGEFKIKKLQDGDYHNFIKWKIEFEEYNAEISFIHELQNYYFDWTQIELLDFKINNNPQTQNSTTV